MENVRQNKFGLVDKGKNMNIIFLDVDGVLNDCSSPHMGNMDELVYFKGEAFLRRSLIILKRIVNKFDAEIVVSSSWRYDKGLIYSLLYALNFYGMNPIDVTPDYKTYASFGTCRGDEIIGWIINSKEKVDNFIILDDYSDMGSVKNHLIKTITTHGLDEKHYKDFVYRFSKGEFRFDPAECVGIPEDLICDIESSESCNSISIKNDFYHCTERILSQNAGNSKQVFDYGYKRSN